jgi:hypothetical protein
LHSITLPALQGWCNSTQTLAAKRDRDAPLKTQQCAIVLPETGSGFINAGASPLYLRNLHISRAGSAAGAQAGEAVVQAASGQIVLKNVTFFSHNCSEAAMDITMSSALIEGILPQLPQLPCTF